MWLPRRRVRPPQRGRGRHCERTDAAPEGLRLRPGAATAPAGEELGRRDQGVLRVPGRRPPRPRGRRHPRPGPARRLGRPREEAPARPAPARHRHPDRRAASLTWCSGTGGAHADTPGRLLPRCLPPLDRVCSPGRRINHSPRPRTFRPHSSAPAYHFAHRSPGRRPVVDAIGAHAPEPDDLFAAIVANLDRDESEVELAATAAPEPVPPVASVAATPDAAPGPVPEPASTPTVDQERTVP